jgi:hypothetical protein
VGSHIGAAIQHLRAFINSFEVVESHMGVGESGCELPPRVEDAHGSSHWYCDRGPVRFLLW